MEKFLRGLAWTIGILAVLTLFGRALLFDVWTVPLNDPTLAASVAPTLRAGDMVLVLKRGTFGFGSLVRCTDPRDPADFVAARIGGIQGDSLDINGRSLDVNGQPYNGESACPEPTYTITHPTSGEPIQIMCDRVRMGGGWHYRGYGKKPLFLQPRSIANVGEGMLYLISDDRDYHDDSRDFGPVPRTSCKGPIIFRIWGKGGFFEDPHRFEFIH